MKLNLNNLMKLSVIVLAISGTYYFISSSRSSGSQAQPQQILQLPTSTPPITDSSQSSSVNPSPDFTPFAKTWSGHGFGIKMSADGTGEASWRTYKSCSQDPTPPCDDPANIGYFSGGGKATLKLLSVTGKTAFGQVESSNAQMLRVDSLTLTILDYDMLLLTQGDIKYVLCGPDFGKLAPESIRKTSPCGA